MALSEESKRCRAAIMHDPEAMRKDTCTAVQSDIVALLGTAGSLPCNDLGRRPGIYALRIQPEGMGQIWQHGLTVVSVNDDLCLYQGWVGKYTLGHWLGMNPEGDCDQTCFLNYSPASAQVEQDSQGQFGHWLGVFKSWQKAYRCQDFDLLSLYGQAAFGVTTDKKDAAILRMVIDRPLRLEWTHTQFKAEFKPQGARGAVALNQVQRPDPRGRCCF